MQITHQSPAKLNVSLSICGKRQDGCHLLQSLICFVDISDTMIFTLTDEKAAAHEAIALTADSDFPLPEDFFQKNLILSAAERLLAKAQKSTAPKTTIHLEKHIPLGAGLGGGSSNAATTLLALNSLWQLNLEFTALVDIAATFGSDIAACLYAKPMWMEDTGNILTPVEVEFPKHILLAFPNVHTCTKDVYAGFSGAMKSAIPLPAELDRTALDFFLQAYGNDLQIPACNLVPEIGELLGVMKDLTGARFTRMTGSGSACFAFFDSAESAAEALDMMQLIFPDYWLRLAQPAI